MPKVAIIVELQLPAPFFIFPFRRPVHRLVAYDLNIIGLWAHEMYEKSSDDGQHA